MAEREAAPDADNMIDLGLKPQFFLNRLLHGVFCSDTFRQAMKNRKRSQRKMEIFILLLIVLLSFLLRLFSVIRNEAIIHEYDPYFNYKLTKILGENHFYDFWDYFDAKSWFPLGRTTGQTLFPGLMLTSHLIWKLCHMLGLLIDIKIVCIYIGPLFSFLTCIMTYILTAEVYPFRGAGLIAALFVSMSPSHVSRTVAGSYDNESIAIFLLLLSLYTWIKCLKEGTLLSALFSSLSTYYMALSWGAYIYITNSISLYMLVILLLKRYQLKNLISFNVYYVLTSILCLNIPCIERSVFLSIEHLSTHAIFVLTNVLLLARHVIVYLRVDKSKFQRKFVQMCFLFFFFIFKFLIFTHNKLSWNHRSRTLLDPTYAAKHNPIVTSISEHQPTTWSSYFFDVHLVLIFVPIGLYECMKKRARVEAFFLGIFSVLCLYFSALMVRLLLIFAPIASVLSAIGLSSLLSRYVRFLRVCPSTYRASLLFGREVPHGEGSSSEGNYTCEEASQGEEASPCEEAYRGEDNYTDGEGRSDGESDVASQASSDSTNALAAHHIDDRIMKLPFNRTENTKVSILTSVCILTLLGYFLILTILHATWCSSIAYSESNITFYSRNEKGERYINDDVRQMYKWIQQNTETDSRIVAWWDYGYQLSVMADRVTYADNNTWNTTHIATVGLILSVNEKQAYDYVKKLDVNYVLVSYGGYSKNSSDDLNKFLWILKITNKEFKHINPLLYYYHDQHHPLGKNATPFMSNSLLYRLSYFNVSNGKHRGYDYIRKLQVPEVKGLRYFEEVFTSDVWGFRLYRVREDV
ncbi:dolichyl-diphosphooligosaccharide-protein glycosyltransferase [Plasmodium inui San Antonio 1]|uniref:dolichyl-diphosphooligosaccharide--protein glycotransferase n=1 Tax=Plasmodium inui San Antonio 1 TaxID=1237626 RepID=W7A1C3_9APIC|nr:dolichyl-diphosphooligosaccharide-protein glycosyltransferase [Plasmodium inui San Antonio 1]EUD65475.1 dolichyl-diphosphooligosaccharide-protein glycosyltransferase [Plasmodium inui San Antonio 1]